jgi:predicted metal-dependent peptidase
MEVFDLIKDQTAEDEEIENHLWETFLEADGTLKKEFIKKIQKLVNDNYNSSILSDEEAAKIEDLKDELDKASPGAGSGVKGIASKIDRSNDNIRWNKLLLDLELIKKVEDKWNSQSRRHMIDYPDSVVPKIEEIEAESMCVFVDVSGSIEYESLKKFVNVVRNIPKNIKVRSFIFNTQVQEFDIFKEDPPAGGGTDFKIIEDYIQKNFTRYPKAIFILTDGDGSPVHPKHKNRWCWLLYGSCSKMYCKDMKNFLLKDLLNR